jgi:TnpA family transposase
VASADGLRFVVPIRTIHSGPNPRYFGRERGVTYYNMTSDQYTGLNGVVIPVAAKVWQPYLELHAELRGAALDHTPDRPGASR